jgi:rod shape-determining protein MreD
MLQSVIVSRLTLLAGTADLVFLVLVAWSLQSRVKYSWLWALIGGLLVSLTSAIPLFAPLFGYMIVVAIARLLQRRFWQIPILAMFALTVLGTLIVQLIEIAAMFVSGMGIPFQDSFTYVTLPSALLNLLLALPVYAVMTDLAKWLYPQEVEV